MSTTKTLLSAAAVLGLFGTRFPALASDHNGQEHSYGGPVQTWCDINPDCNGWNKGLHRSPTESGAPGFVASPAPKPRPARKLGHVASNR
jgi:hypothetical protein